MQSVEEFRQICHSKYRNSLYRESRCRGCKRKTVALWKKCNPDKVSEQHGRRSEARALKDGRVYSSLADRQARAKMRYQTKRAVIEARRAWRLWLYETSPDWWRSAHAAARSRAFYTRNRESMIARVAKYKRGNVERNRVWGKTRYQRQTILQSSGSGIHAVHTVIVS